MVGSWLGVTPQLSDLAGVEVGSHTVSPNISTKRWAMDFRFGDHSEELQCMIQVLSKLSELPDTNP